MNRALQLVSRRNLLQIQPIARNISTTGARNSGVWLYRRSGEGLIPKRNYVLAEAIGGFVWFWVLYHLWHEPDHILGEFPYPDPSKWTDQELGIPPK